MSQGRIAFQGELGANSHEACAAYFLDYEPVPHPTFDEAFEAYMSSLPEEDQELSADERAAFKARFVARMTKDNEERKYGSLPSEIFKASLFSPPLLCWGVSAGYVPCTSPSTSPKGLCLVAGSVTTLVVVTFGCKSSIAFVVFR